MANEVRIKLTDEQKAKIRETTGQEVGEIRVSNLGHNPAVTPASSAKVASPRTMQQSARAVQARTMQQSARAVQARTAQPSARAVQARTAQPSARAVQARTAQPSARAVQARTAQPSARAVQASDGAAFGPGGAGQDRAGSPQSLQRAFDEQLRITPLLFLAPAQRPGPAAGALSFRSPGDLAEPAREDPEALSEQRRARPSDLRQPFEPRLQAAVGILEARERDDAGGCLGRP